MASLESVKQKIVRAAEHLKSLEAEAMRYFSANPGEVVTEEEPHSHRIVLKFRERIPVPVAVPLIIGDVLQNLRSSLDYLVWQLFEEKSLTPLPKSGFPIMTSVASENS